MSGFLGSGDVLIDVFLEDGSSTGLDDAGNTTKFAITEKSELKNRVSRGRNTYGQVLDSAAVKTPPEFAISLDDAKGTNIGMALLAAVSAINQGAGTVTGLEISAVAGKWIDLGKRNINTSGFVVTDSATGLNTYNLGTDYEVNYRMGLIKALSGGSVADKEALKVDFGYSAVTGTKLSGSAMPTIKCRVVLDGKNFADGSNCIVEVYHAMLTPTGDFDFMAEKWATIDLKGPLITPPGKTSPYHVELIDA